MGLRYKKNIEKIEKNMHILKGLSYEIDFENVDEN
jgi:hypothetical protein